VSEWLEVLDPRPGLSGAAFGTRAAMPWVPGSAANAIGRRLRRRGVPLVGPAQSFHVIGMEGPLVEGELERARAWGEELGATCTVLAADAR